MAENFEHPGHDDPQGESSPGGDFPKDFFNDPVAPSPAPQTPSESPVNPQAVPSAMTTRPSVREPAPPPIGPPSAYKAPQVEPIEDEGFKKSAFPAMLGAAMACVLVVSWFVNLQKPAPAAVATTAPATSPTVEPTPTPVTTAETEALNGKIKDLAARVEELTAQVKAVDGKLNDLPKPEPAPNLKPLEGKVNELGKSVAVVGPLNEKVSKLGDRVGSVDGALKSIKGDLAALKEQINKSAPASAPAPAVSESKPAGDETAAAMTSGVDLFKAGKYKEAAEVFNKLASTNPKDARVYYYAALSRGLSTSDWQGETLSTAAKGAELEKAGSPRAPEVDAAFADLPANLKPWVTYFRQQAK